MVRKRTRSLWLATLTLAFGVVLTGTLAVGASAGGTEDSCATVEQYSLERQTNIHAAQILASCGRGETGGFALHEFSALRRLGATAPELGGVDRDVTAGAGDVLPHITQSETQTWAEGNTTVVTYNDSKTAPSCYSGGSVSQDNGTSWTYLNSRPFCTGHGTGFGDPVVVYDRAHTKWVAIFLASGCGGQGLGVWTSPDGVTWSTGACAHNGSSDDRESGWVDNDPSSPFYGRIYVSWNNFAVGGGALQVAWSSDGALTWSAPVTVNPSFNRNVQVTTGVGGTGTVFIASMNEGGGGTAPRHEPRLPLDQRRRHVVPDHHGAVVRASGSGELQHELVLPRHVQHADLRLLALHGLGRHRRRPERDHPLRVHAGRRGR